MEVRKRDLRWVEWEETRRKYYCEEGTVNKLKSDHLCLVAWRFWLWDTWFLWGGLSRHLNLQNAIKVDARVNG